MKEDRFIPPQGAFTRTVPIRFSHCDPAGIVYFPHYFDMFNGLIEDWYTEQLGVDYAKLILNDRYGFPLCSHRNRLQKTKPNGGTPGSYITSDENRTVFIECCYRGSFGWR